MPFSSTAMAWSLDAFYRTFTGFTETFEDICYQRKKQIIHELFRARCGRSARSCHRSRWPIARARFRTGGVDGRSSVTACLGVYRTYIREGQAPNPTALHSRGDSLRARPRRHDAGRAALRVSEHVLLVDPPPYTDAERENWLAFVMRWQQFTGRVMAKGVEDTAFYNYNRLISLNDVGSNPGRHDFDGLAEFHQRNCRIQKQWPHTLNTTSTHDTKRSEDVRARINVLSEIPETWTRQVRRWSKMNGHLRRDGVPHPNEELALYQTLIGMWPLNSEELPVVPERLRQFLEKALREGKTHTSWIAPDIAYEEAVLHFGEAILSDQNFCKDFMRFQKRIAFYGAINALAQTVLKLCASGVPDFYQGTELWDFSLVDPDNRRPVDYERRSAMLRTIKEAHGRRSLI
jgi:(1->4)-alpha-D-glucan 1-alpha-D-glucosylmutase